MSSDDTNLPKFIFPKDTKPILVTWFNDIYGDEHSFTEEDTYVICGEIWQHPEIEDIADQIWNELLELYERGESWSIIR